jgi:hypothetical protein
LIAKLPIFLERLLEDVHDLRRHRRVALANVLRRPVEDGVEHHAGRRARERPSAGQHLRDRRAEREDVAACIQRLTAHLLRRHIRDRPECLAGRGDERVGHRFPDALLITHQLGQAEVEDLRLILFGDEDVRGLDIAMDDALRMRRHQRLGDLQRQAEHGFRFQPRGCEQFGERAPFERLHDDEVRAFVLVDVVDRADVRMVERRSRARLALESLECRRIAGHVLRKELERDGPAQTRVFSLVDHTHAAAAEFGHDAIPRDHAAVQIR